MTRIRARLAALLVLVLAGAGAPAAARAADPPRAKAIERATERFLAEHGNAPSAAARARGSGGVAEAAPGAVLGAQRVVSLYGAPQMGATILGLRSPQRAAAKLSRQSAPYAVPGELPVLGEFDLVSVFATAGGGSDNLYRTRQDPQVIQIYLDQARAVGARLMLDVQPGRSTFLKEMRALKPWLLQPDVDLALDPEWNVGLRGIPGRTEGSVRADEVNRVAKRLARLVRANGLPPKLLVVHQFRRGSVRGRKRLDPGLEVQTVLNFDGIGSPAAKANGYAALAAPGIFNGFSLFYRRDRPLMDPAAVLGLVPQPDFLLYQ